MYHVQSSWCLKGIAQRHDEGMLQLHQYPNIQSLNLPSRRLCMLYFLCLDDLLLIERFEGVDGVFFLVSDEADAGEQAISDDFDDIEVVDAHLLRLEPNGAFDPDMAGVAVEVQVFDLRLLQHLCTGFLLITQLLLLVVTHCSLSLSQLTCRCFDLRVVAHPLSPLLVYLYDYQSGLRGAL